MKKQTYMKKNLVLITSFLLCLLGTGGCEDNGKFSNPELLKTWKLVGFGTTENDEIQTAQPENCDKCYVLTFLEDYTITGRSVNNTLSAKFEISGNNLSFPNGIGGTEIAEEGEYPKKYLNGLEEVHSFEIKNSQLKLYYSDNSFLLFNLKIE